MLFNSLSFIFIFFPTTVFTYFKLARINRTLTYLWLAGMSLLFYGIWGPIYVLLLLASIICNYIISTFIQAKSGNTPKKWLIVGIGFNLGLLVYFKYANFFVDQYNALFNLHWQLPKIILPLGISFFTFTQIAFLVDVFRKEVQQYDFVEYLLFVTYFPHLIAGPIIHHKEVIPQFRNSSVFQLKRENVNIGLMLFGIGLIKKMLFADHFGNYANSIFDHLNSGTPLLFVEAWLGTLAYTFQLYFDFSGYSDMALGLSKVFGIVLPLNFNSPYKSKNIIEFWRRWHITLSRWLRDYLYIPLGGSRCGQFRRFFNLFVTMLLGGFWHGASWTFVIWGGLHGLYLILNHTWRGALKKLNWQFTTSKYFSCLSVVFTFILVCVAWVFFRAVHVPDALIVIKGLFGLNGFYEKAAVQQQSPVFFSSAHLLQFFPLHYITNKMVFIWLFFGFIIVWFLPNSAEIFNKHNVCLLTYNEKLRSINVKFIYRLQHIPSRIWVYMLLSYILICALAICFYTTNIDEKLYHILPVKLNPLHVDNTEGDFRSNFYTTTAVDNPFNKIIFVGSSYTTSLGNFRFTYQNQEYQSGTVGIGGNGLVSGFRSAMALLSSPIASKNLKVIVFGVSPLGFGSMSHFNSAPFNGQCFDEVNKLGFNFPDVPLGHCTGNASINLKTAILLFVNPNQEMFYQLHNFFGKVLSMQLLPPSYDIQRLTLSKKSRDDFIANLDAKIQQSRINPLPVYNPKNGIDTSFQWQKRGILESIQPGAAIYNAFLQLKHECDKRNIRLVVYTSPTPRHAFAPDIYPEGFLEKYEVAIQNAMNQLGIEYYDLIDLFPFNGSFMTDFIHPDASRRPVIQEYLLYQILGVK